MVNEVTSFGDYRCVHCMVELALSDSQQLWCGQCSRRYPIVQQIAILAACPNVLLQKHYDTLAEPKTELLKLREYLLTLTSGDPPSALHRRIQRALHGMAQSIALMETIMQPVADYVKSGAMGPFAPVDWLLGQEIGYKYWEALPNFYQDWARIPEFEFAESLIDNG